MAMTKALNSSVFAVILLGLTGTGPGAMVVAVGALLLGVAGVVALVTDRHAHEDQAV